jgi:hypothetical protein
VSEQVDALEDERSSGKVALVTEQQQTDGQQQMQLQLMQLQEKMVQVEAAMQVQEAQEQVQVAAKAVHAAEAQQVQVEHLELAGVVAQSELDIKDIWTWLDGEGREAREKMNKSDVDWNVAEDYVRQCLAGRLELLEEEVQYSGRHGLGLLDSLETLNQFVCSMFEQHGAKEVKTEERLKSLEALAGAQQAEIKQQQAEIKQLKKEAREEKSKFDIILSDMRSQLVVLEFVTKV